jgi:K+-sensing histidine kinase KdpD
MATDHAAPSTPQNPDLAAAAPADDDPATPASSPRARPSPALGYGVSVLMVGAATIIAFVVDNIIPASNLSLVFVLPVIVAALSFGWGPALISAMLSVAVFDFFFVAPRMSFRVDSPSDLWALALLLIVAAIASTVGAQARDRQVATRRAVQQAEALHGLADAVIAEAPAPALLTTAAGALSQIFDAPAIVLAEKAGKLWPAAAAGGASLSAADAEAAHWALANGQATRGETYPFDTSGFDFWPVLSPANHRLVLGVKLTGLAGGRPKDPNRQVDMVAAYLSAALGGGARR